MKKIFVIALLALSFGAQSAIIKGHHVTDDGKQVDLIGLEWLSWDVTYGFSGDQIKNGFVNSFLADGWRYATVSEFGQMISSIAGSTVGWAGDNADGAKWLWENFDAPDYNALRNNSRTGDLYLAENYKGHWRAARDGSGTSYPVTQGWFHGQYGATGIAYTKIPDYVTYASHVLVREAAPASSPAVIGLFLLGLCGLFLRRKGE